jgi:integrase
MSEFSEPALSPSDKNMEKEWFVHFRIYLENGTSNQYRFKTGLNGKDVRKNKRERVSLANKMIFYFKQKLEEGWRPDNSIIVVEYKKLTDSLDDLLAVNKSAWKQKTNEGYKDSVKMFKNWLTDQGLDDIIPERFTNKSAHEYLDYLLRDRNYSGKSHNSQLGNMKSFFNYIFKRDKERFKNIDNPFSDIAKMPEEVGKIFALTKEERKKVQYYLKFRKDPFYYCCCFMYYLALRRPDLANIKKADIDLKNKMVRLHSSASKNRQQDSVTIMPAFEKILEKMNLESIPNHYYIFGPGFVPAETKMTRVNDFTEYFRNVAVKLKLDPTKTFYGLKASGLSDLYTATKDIYIVKTHARHSDIRITMRYLKSLGLLVDEQVRNVDIKF